MSTLYPTWKLKDLRGVTYKVIRMIPTEELDLGGYRWDIIINNKVNIFEIRISAATQDSPDDKKLDKRPISWKRR